MPKKTSDSDKKPKEKKSAKKKLAKVVPTAKEPATPAAVLPPLPVMVPAPASTPAPAAQVKKAPAKKTAPKPKAVATRKPAPAPIILSNDDIALRAYYIAERRQKMGWPGDSTSDWVEAERQLRAEAAKAR